MTAAAARTRLAAFRPRREELRDLVLLATPVAVVQMGLVSQGLVDTAMVGRVTATELGAVTLGNVYFFSVVVFGMGLLFALDPLVSQAFGAEDHDEIEVSIQRGLLLSVGLAAVTSALLAVAEPVFVLLRQPPEVIPVAAGYARALIGGMLPFYAFIVFRQVLQAVGRVAPVVWTIVLANLLNAGANWVLIYGNLGGPAMGALGSGWATTISRVVHVRVRTLAGKASADCVPAAHAAGSPAGRADTEDHAARLADRPPVVPGVRSLRSDRGEHGLAGDQCDRGTPDRAQPRGFRLP